MHLAWIELRDFRNHRGDPDRGCAGGLDHDRGTQWGGQDQPPRGDVLPLRAPVAADLDQRPARARGERGRLCEGEFEGLDGRALVEAEIPRKGASRVKLNTNPLRRKRELRRQVRAVLFGPFDLPAVIGDPSKRRDLMDEALVALWPLRDTLSSGYDKVLRQRNRLLKEWGGRPGWSSRARGLGRGADPGGRSADRGTRRGRRAPRAGRLHRVRGAVRLRADRVVRPQRGRGGIGRGAVPSPAGGAAGRRARPQDVARRPAPRRPHPRRSRPRGPGVRLPRRDVGRGTVPPARDRGGGGRRGRGAAAPARRRSVQRARPPPSDRIAARLRRDPVKWCSRSRTRPTCRRPRPRSGTSAPAT